MCAKCPQSRTEMKAVYGMGVQKVESYGENFIKIIAAFLKEYGNMRTTEETVAEPLRKKKQPFYIAPEKLDEVVASTMVGGADGQVYGFGIYEADQ